MKAVFLKYVRIALLLGISGCCRDDGPRNLSRDSLYLYRSIHLYHNVDSWHRALKPNQHRTIFDSGRQKISFEDVEREALECEPSGQALPNMRPPGPWVDLYVQVNTLGHRKHFAGRDFLVGRMRVWSTGVDSYRDDMGMTFEIEVATEDPKIAN